MEAGGARTRSFVHPWSYWTPIDAGITELGWLAEGQDTALKTHFHDEVQVTIVLSGSRAFLVGGERIVCSAAECMVFPAGVPHRPLPGEMSGARCLNIYLPASSNMAEQAKARIEDLIAQGGLLDEDEDGIRTQLCELLHGLNSAVRCSTPAGSSRRMKSVGASAARANLSREGFSRRFSRKQGMPPHAFGVMTQLNVVRRLLRDGEDLASVAAQTGFADQSHMGRWFRASFGTTPGKYRQR